MDDAAAVRQARFDGLRKRAAQSLNLPEDHERVCSQAAIWLVYEGTVSKFISTGHLGSDLAAFVRMSELVNETAPPPPPPEHRVELVIIGKDGKPIRELPFAAAPPAEARTGADLKAAVVPSTMKDAIGADLEKARKADEGPRPTLRDMALKRNG
jgi:hypothetical protein